MGTTKIKATKTKNTDNKILVIASTTATSTPKLGDAAPTTSDSSILFLAQLQRVEQGTRLSKVRRMQRCMKCPQVEKSSSLKMFHLQVK